MKKIAILAIVVAIALLLTATPPVSAHNNTYTAFVDQGIIITPEVGERAYYPTVAFDGTSYLMIYDNKVGGEYVGNYAISDDGIHWTLEGSVSGLKNNNHSYHSVMLYDANGFEGEYNYKIWYLDMDAEVPHGAGSIRYAESDDGIHWVNDQPVFGGNMISKGVDNVDAPSRTWGPGTVIYNPEATNTGDNPLDYSYVIYYDGYNGNSDDPAWDGNEALFLAYSVDGKDWSRYTRNPVLKGSSDGWDATCVGYPTVMRISDGSYIMWYCGGRACNEGIGFATSHDGANWVKDEDNPMFHKSDETDPPGYRAGRTYTPRVIDDGSGELKMYYSAKSETGIYAIGLATLRLEVPATIDIHPDTLNLRNTGRWVSCYIELPEDYDVADIDVSTILLDEVIQAELHPTEIGDYDGDGIVDLMVQFERAEVEYLIRGLEPDLPADIELIVTGQVAGMPFEGSDTVRVIDKGKK